MRDTSRVYLLAPFMCWACLLSFVESARAAGAVLLVPSVQYPTIQSAFDAAQNGDEVVVSPGVYLERVNFADKSFVARSIDPTSPSCVSGTTIDAGQAGPVVRFGGGESAACLLSGFTLRNGRAPNGGGVLGNGALATIRGNVIAGNTALDYGGGMFRCDGLVYDNIVTSNSALEGGGIYMCNGAIRGNEVTSNSALIHGGGLYGCIGAIQSNLVARNNASEGGGIASCSGELSNNIVRDNSAGWGGGIFDCDGGIYNNTIYGNSATTLWVGIGGGGVALCDGEISNCVIWANTAATDPQVNASSDPTYCCIEDWAGAGAGNITSDPQLTAPAVNDFHLRATSPCIDAGRFIGGLTKDFEGDRRPFDGVAAPRGDGSDFDIGADEYAQKTLWRVF